MISEQLKIVIVITEAVSWQTTLADEEIGGQSSEVGY